MSAGLSKFWSGKVLCDGSEIEILPDYTLIVSGSGFAVGWLNFGDKGELFRVALLGTTTTEDSNDGDDLLWSATKDWLIRKESGEICWPEQKCMHSTIQFNYSEMLDFPQFIQVSSLLLSYGPSSFSLCAHLRGFGFTNSLRVEKYGKTCAPSSSTSSAGVSKWIPIQFRFHDNDRHHHQK